MQTAGETPHAAGPHTSHRYRYPAQTAASVNGTPMRKKSAVRTVSP